MRRYIRPRPHHESHVIEIIELHLQEEGQCGFFQWQDQVASQAKKQYQSAAGQDASYAAGLDTNSEPHAPETPQCRCGLIAVQITSQSAANPGRTFYKCPKSEVSLGV